MSRNRPNLLVLVVDQLAAAWLPAHGHEVVHAPNLSALAATGVTFDAAYCPSPLCAPSRAAMLTGRHPSSIGVFDNAAELPATVPTIAHHLRARGYRTALAGKMHFVGPDQLHGFERRLTTDIAPAGIDWTPDWTRELGDRLPWYHSMESVLTPAATVASMQTDYDDEVCFHAARHIHDLARERSDRPFLLVASFANPHDPWEVPSRYWDLYDPADVALPAVAKIAIERADPHSRRLREMSGIDAEQLSDEQVRRARHAYYAAISYVDERIGTLLAELERAGLEGDTTIAFTADHGEFLGERGLWYKMSFLDPSARVPLIVRVPGAAGGRRVAQPVSLLDLAPTLLGLAGDGAGAADARLDGESLVGLLAGEPDSSRGPVICEYHAEGVTAPAAMIRDGRHKLIVCEGDPDQLFDLDADPHELCNLADRPEHAAVASTLREALTARLDLAEIKRRVLASQRDRRAVISALARGEGATWDYRPPGDASIRYMRTGTDLYDVQRRARLESP
jgi:choline-sulfatase